jgi:hypothetical protein
MLSYKVITQPTVEPVSLTQLKQHLVLDPTFTQDDAILGVYLLAARQYAEQYTNRAILPQTVLLSLDHFPYPHCSTSHRPGHRHAWISGAGYLDQSAIYLPRPTLIDVTSITYVDGNGVTQTVDPSTYKVDTVSEPARVSPNFGLYWPLLIAYELGSVQVTYQTGTWATPDDVPATIQLAIMLLAAHWYANRESTSQTNLNSIPFGVEAILDMHKSSSVALMRD